MRRRRPPSGASGGSYLGPDGRLDDLDGEGRGRGAGRSLWWCRRPLCSVLRSPPEAAS